MRCIDELILWTLCCGLRDYLGFGWKRLSVRGGRIHEHGSGVLGVRDEHGQL